MTNLPYLSYYSARQHYQAANIAHIETTLLQQAGKPLASGLVTPEPFNYNDEADLPCGLPRNSKAYRHRRKIPAWKLWI